MENTNPDNGSHDKFDEEESKPINNTNNSESNNTDNSNKEVLTQTIDKEIQITKNNLNIDLVTKENSDELLENTCKKRNKRSGQIEKITLLNALIDAVDNIDDNNLSVEITDKTTTIEISSEDQSLTMKVKNMSKGGSTTNNDVRGLTVQVDNDFCKYEETKENGWNIPPTWDPVPNLFVPKPKQNQLRIEDTELRLLKSKRNLNYNVYRKPSDSTKTHPVKNKIVNPRTRALEAMNKPVEIDRAVKMMHRMGWTGGSLGVRGDGITEPIMPALNQVSRAGLGHVQPKSESEPNTTNFSKNKRKTGKKFTGNVTQPKSLFSINFNHMPDDVAHLLTRKDLTAINKLFKNQHKLKAREPPQFRLDFLTKLLEFITTDNNVIVIKYYPALLKKERRFVNTAVKVLSERSNLGLIGDEMVKVVQILQVLNNIPDLKVTCCFKTKFDIELTKIQKSISIKRPTPKIIIGLNIIDINVTKEEMLPNLKEILKGAPPMKSQKTYDTIKFRVEILLKLIYFFKLADLVMEIVYDRPISVKQHKYLLSVVGSLNRRVKFGCNKCEMVLFQEILKYIGFWMVTIKLSQEFSIVTITKENVPQPSKKQISFKPNTKKKTKPTIDREFYKDDLSFTTDQNFNEDDLMMVEPYIETIIINDDSDGENKAQESNNMNIDENVIINFTIKQENDIEIEDVRSKVQIPKPKDAVVVNDTQLNTSNTVANTVVVAGKTELNDNSNKAQNINVNNDIDSCVKDINDMECLINNISDEILTNNNTAKTVNNTITHESTDTGINDINETPEVLNNTDSQAEVTEKILNGHDILKNDIKNKKIHDSHNFNLEHKQSDVKGNDINIETGVSKDNLEVDIDNKQFLIHSITEKCETDQNINIKKEPSLDYLYDCIVCFVPNNYPKDDIDEKKIIEIQLTISSNIISNKELPLLKCHGVQNGALIYSCHSKNSFDFIKKIISVVSDVKIDNKKVDTMLLKFKTFFDFNIEYLFHMLEMYNPELSTKDWTVIDTDVNIKSVTLITKMDNISINYILQSQLALYAGVDKVEFSIYLN